MTKNKYLLSLIGLVPALLFVLILSCNKRDVVSDVNNRSLPDYAGSSADISKIVAGMQRVDKDIHFSSSMPDKAYPEYDKVLFTQLLSDTTGSYIFPVKSSQTELSWLLRAFTDRNGDVLKVEVIHCAGSLKNAEGRKDSMLVAGLFSAFGRRGFSIPAICDSLNRLTQKSSVDKSGVGLSMNRAARGGDAEPNCENYYNFIIDFNPSGLGCYGGAQGAGNLIIDQMCQKLRESVAEVMNTAIVVERISGIGIKISGKVSAVTMLSTGEIYTRLQTYCMDLQIRSQSLFGCSMSYIGIGAVEFISGNCENVGQPPTGQCENKTFELAQAQVDASIATATESLEILPGATGGVMLNDESTGEYVRVERPRWPFFTYSINLGLGPIPQKYTLYFNSERYVSRTPKEWKSFSYAGEIPEKISLSSGAIPPCFDAEMEVKSVICNLSPDNLTAEAAVRYHFTLKAACVFGWALKSKSNEDDAQPLTNTFSAQVNY